MYVLIYLLVEKYKKFIDNLPKCEPWGWGLHGMGGEKKVPDFALAGVFLTASDSLVLDVR